jgi:hypothetical protein
MCVIGTVNRDFVEHICSHFPFLECPRWKYAAAVLQHARRCKQRTSFRTVHSYIAIHYILALLRNEGPSSLRKMILDMVLFL